MARVRNRMTLFARTACLLLALFLLAATAVHIPFRAAQADVDTVTGQLNTMMGAGIDPAWPPDIEANAALVESTLAAFRRCTPAERAAFTEQQRADLRAYFETLYGIQGRDPAELDALFAGGVDASGPASSSVPESSAPQSSTPEESAPQSDSEPVSGSEPDSGSASGSTGPIPSPSGVIPGAGNNPQTPGGEGLAGFLGNNVLATFLLLLLVLLVIFVFVRFLAAQRAAGREKAVADEAAAEENPEKAATLPFVLNQPAGEEPPRRRTRRRKKRKKGETPPEEAPKGAPELDDAHLWSSTPEEASIWDDPLAATAARGGPAVEPETPPATADEPALEAKSGGEAGPATPRNSANGGKTRRELPQKAKRTGRPKRMPFRVGSENDLDGIDD